MSEYNEQRAAFDKAVITVRRQCGKMERVI